MMESTILLGGGAFLVVRSAQVLVVMVRAGGPLHDHDYWYWPLVAFTIAITAIVAGLGVLAMARAL